MRQTPSVAAVRRPLQRLDPERRAREGQGHLLRLERRAGAYHTRPTGFSIPLAPVRVHIHTERGMAEVTLRPGRVGLNVASVERFLS